VIAGKLVGYVMADLEALCREAGMAALTRIEASSSSSSLSITTEDFEKAMKRTTPSALK
jgi:transitional endoplasmic reticulum ATPase